MHARLVRVGLASPRDVIPDVTLGQLLARFEASAAVKASTHAAYRQATGSLRDHFGAEKPLRSITHSDADGWHKATADAGLAPATVAKRVNVAKSVFRRAIRWGLIPASPFADLRSGSQSNPERSHYVSCEVIRAVLDA